MVSILMKYVLLTILGVGGLMAVSFGIKVLFFPVNTANKLIETAYDAQDKVLNADNAIYNYEWFKQQKEDIDAMGNKYENASQTLVDFMDVAGERSIWTFEDKTEYSRLNAVKLGIKNQLEQAIADYNARSKMATRNIFADGVLPSYIDALTFINK